MHGLACKMTSRTPHPLKHGEALAHAPFQRPAFSLAEIMIAIGILGVGMLMVAATFPVGLDQCRIVSEQTIAPLVAEDAFQRLRLLMSEPDSLKRIGLWPLGPSDLPTKSFRESLSLISNSSPIRYTLPDDAGNLTPINELLRAPYNPNDGAGLSLYGAATGFYPSVPADISSALDKNQVVRSTCKLPLRNSSTGAPALVEPPYTWSTVFRRLADGSVQFFVFVNRRGSTWPTDWPRTAKVNEGEHSWTPADPVLPGPLLDADGKPLDMAKFSDGAFLVSSPDGNILRIKEVNRRENTITLDRAPGVSEFWFIEADPATGQSPCIGVYSRTFPL